MKEYCVYTYYDCLKQPLYSGKSRDCMQRFSNHWEPWMDQVCYIGVKKYANAMTMHMSEIDTISKLRPVFNKEFLEDEDEIRSIPNFKDRTKENVYHINDFCRIFSKTVRKEATDIHRVREFEIPSCVKFRKKGLNEKERKLIAKYPNAVTVASVNDFSTSLTEEYKTFRIGNCFYSIRYMSKNEHKINKIRLKDFVFNWNGIYTEAYNDRVIFEIEYPDINDAIYPIIDIETPEKSTCIRPMFKAKVVGPNRMRYEMIPVDSFYKQLCKKGKYKE